MNRHAASAILAIALCSIAGSEPSRSVAGLAPERVLPSQVASSVKADGAFAAEALDERTARTIEATVDGFAAKAGASYPPNLIQKQLPETLWAKRMVRLFALPDFEEKLTRATLDPTRLTYNYLDALARDPARAKREIKEVLSALRKPAPEEAYAPAATVRRHPRHALRASILLTLSWVPELRDFASNEARRELSRVPSDPLVAPFSARSEAERDAALSLSSEQLAPVLAYQVLLELAPHARAAASAAAWAFERQPHFPVRLAIEGLFHGKFPNEEAALRHELAVRRFQSPTESILASKSGKKARVDREPASLSPNPATARLMARYLAHGSVVEPDPAPMRAIPSSFAESHARSAAAKTARERHHWFQAMARTAETDREREKAAGLLWKEALRPVKLKDDRDPEQFTPALALELYQRTAPRFEPGEALRRVRAVQPDPRVKAILDAY